jgi:hypothetical protein
MNEVILEPVKDKSNMLALADQIGKEEGLPPEANFLKMVNQESGGNSYAISPKGAKGLAQIMPNTAKDFKGLNIDIPEDNARIGARYLKQLYNKFGDWGLAHAAYNAGPGAVEKYGGIPPFTETQNHVKKIMGESPQSSREQEVELEPVEVSLEPVTEETKQGQERSSVEKAVRNIPKSAVQFGKNIVEPILHPIDTATNLYKIGSGAVQTLIPGEQENEQYAQAAWQFLKDRYGSMENIKKTFEEDPVGMAADVSTVFTGGAGLISKIPGMAKVASIVGKVGQVSEPINIAKNIIQKGIAASGLDKKATGLYESALKASTTLKPSERTKRIETGLREGIPVTESGGIKLRANIDNINTEIDSMIANSAQSTGFVPGLTIRKDALLQNIDNMRQMALTSDNPVGNLAMLEKYKERWNILPNEIPVDQAQKIKQSVYRGLKNKYGKMNELPIETRKTFARGIKEELEGVFPELKNLNAKEGAMIGLEESLQRALARIGNRDLIGLGEVVAGTAGAAASGGKVGFITGLARKLIDHPGVKSHLALALAKTGETKFNSGAMKTKILAYQAGRTSLIPNVTVRNDKTYFDVTPNKELNIVDIEDDQGGSQ